MLELRSARIVNEVLKNGRGDAGVSAQGEARNHNKVVVASSNDDGMNRKWDDNQDRQS